MVLMPQLVTIPYPLSDIIDSFDPPQNRKPGWHVTDLFKVAEVISKGGQVPDGGFSFYGDTSGLMSWGRMWEGAVRGWLVHYASALGLTFEPSVETDSKSIIANLDGLVWLDTRIIAVIEIKATTGKPSPFDHPNWISQTKAYCHMVGVNQVWFVVLHMPRRGAPEAKVYLDMVTFEDWELEENWRMLASTKEYLESKGIKLWQ